MAASKTSNPFSNILKNPSEIMNVINNPGKYGIDFYNSLSAQNKQYVAFAAAAGLIIYGLTLNKNKR